MATYSLDTEHHTIVTIDWQDYAVWLIQEQDELIERIKSIDETMKVPIKLTAFPDDNNIMLYIEDEQSVV
jgi:hypothetical protein